MGAGGCREPRTIKRNPGRGSQRLRRALGGTRILLAAAPTEPPCFCHWQRSSRPVLKKCLQNKKSSTRFGYWISWWARVDYASRASKKAPQGLFCPPDYSVGRCCSNPPSRVKLEITVKTKNQRIFYAGLFGGRGWIRTTEAESSRFTVCPHWPLGNTPIFIFVRPFAGRLAYFSMGNGFCQLFFTFFFKGFLRPSKAGCGNVDGFVRKRRTSVFFAAKIFIR